MAREACRLCGACVENCAAGALAVKGYRVSTEAIVAKAERMKPFFDHTGGGVTLTGGETTLQPDFALAVLEGCRERGIHTAVETAGACEFETIERIAGASDLVLYDLKLIDDAEHRRWVGATNERILDNAARLAGGNIEVRIPLIPGVTDKDENLGGLFRFCAANGLTRVALLPSNPSAAAKYEWLGLDYELESEPQSAERLGEILSEAARQGLSATIA
jgi:pyruvate formate lyase activating enzyme